ncbi:MAG TPA: DinB family protein [Chitinophagaceae bacterium]|jgi:hypothetical protein|nr:DinB family protein [Chitinophagaceae bacterium]
MEIKIDFLQHKLIPLMSSLDEHTKPLFGKMNVQQMIEHMGYAFRQASGLIPIDALNNEEITAKMYSFMMSERPFKDNTPNPYLPETPAPAVFETKEQALIDLQKDIHQFFATFENDKSQRILNPFFGNLNFDEWVHLLHKHANHHLRQFGINL